MLGEWPLNDMGSATMGGSKTIRFGLMLSGAAAMLGGLVACAQLPPSMAEQGWSDLWGDRGAGVLARDYHMCADLVEQRRGLLAGCMEARGWKIN